MPFDGVETPFNYLAKFDQVIEFIESPGKWVKHTYRTPSGRYCLKEVLNTVGIAEVFEPLILKVAEATTGREFCCVESFNDHPETLRGDVITVLRQTRSDILAGKIALPRPATAMPAPLWSEGGASGRGSWAATLWQKLSAWS
ncbi:MAG TPA: hypothetical protein VME45_21135 [Stellaceae bacterium]|nr:hypothetical protein [Stellaceae bacterium]